MNTAKPDHNFRTILLGLILMIPCGVLAGDITGTVTDAATGQPVTMVVVTAKDQTGRVLATTRTDGSGEFRLKGLPAHEVTVAFDRMGYASVSHVEVDPGNLSATFLDVEMEGVPVSEDVLIVTASRRQEKALDAPASTSVVGKDVIERWPQKTTADPLRDVRGIDFAEKGLIQRTYAARGTRATQSGVLQVLNDFRYAGVPVNDWNIPYLVPLIPEDIDRIEVVRGPGSALYGPNAHRGVVNIISKSPLDDPGGSGSFSYGERAFLQGNLRYAEALSSKVGLKFSGSYVQGNDWEYWDPVEQELRQDAIADGADPDTLRIGRRDFNVERAAVEARLDWRPDPETEIILTGGTAQAYNVVEPMRSDLAIQVQDWRSGFLQGRLHRGRLDAQVAYNEDDGGNSFNLRTGIPTKSNNSLWSFRLQHGFDLADKHPLVYGIDGRKAIPRSEGTLTGRYEDDDEVVEMGAFLSGTWKAAKKLDLVGALRLDNHDRLDNSVISARAAAVFKPTGDQAIRLAWNRAFSSPPAYYLFQDYVIQEIPGTGMDARVLGNGGQTFDVARLNGDVGMYSGFNPAGNDQLLPLDATALWPVAVQFLQSYGIDVSGITPPTASDVGTNLLALDASDATFSIPVPLQDVESLYPEEARRQIWNSVEFGYQGRLGERLHLEAETYWTRVENPYGDSYVMTPNAFLDQAALSSYLETTGGMPADQAALAAAIASQLPLGTVAPSQSGTADLLVGQYQGGSYDYWGADAMLEYTLTQGLRARATYSWVDKNYFELPGIGTFHTAVPLNKGSLGLVFEDPYGRFDANATGRGVESYRLGSQPNNEIDGYIIFDVGVGYQLTWWPSVRLSVNAFNVFDDKHREMVASPELGRLIVGRVNWQF